MNKIIKQRNVSSYLLLILIIVNLISFLNVDLLAFYNLYSVFGNFMFLVVIFLLKPYISSEEYHLFLFVIIFSFYNLFTLYLTGGGIGSVLVPSYSMLVFLILKRTKFSRRQLIFLTVVMIIVNLYLVINSLGYNDRYIYQKANLINSNTVSLVIAYTAIYISIFLEKIKWKLGKYIKWIIFISSIWGIVNAQSRGSLIFLFSFILLNSLVFNKIFYNKKKTLTVVIITIIVGVLIPYVYTLLYKNGFNFVFPFINKSLYTGREIIWLIFFEEMNKADYSLFFGLGSNIQIGNFSILNLHNNYLAVFSNFGAIGFILYYLFWLLQINNIYKFGKITRYKKSLLIGFLGVLIYGFFEISTLYSPLFFLNFMFLGLAAQKNDV